MLIPRMCVYSTITMTDHEQLQQIQKYSAHFIAFKRIFELPLTFVSESSISNDVLVPEELLELPVDRP